MSHVTNAGGGFTSASAPKKHTILLDIAGYGSLFSIRLLIIVLQNVLSVCLSNHPAKLFNSDFKWFCPQTTAEVSQRKYKKKMVFLKTRDVGSFVKGVITSCYICSGLLPIVPLAGRILVSDLLGPHAGRSTRGVPPPDGVGGVPHGNHDFLGGGERRRVSRHRLHRAL